MFYIYTIERQMYVSGTLVDLQKKKISYINLILWKRVTFRQEFHVFHRSMLGMS